MFLAAARLSIENARRQRHVQIVSTIPAGTPTAQYQQWHALALLAVQQLTRKQLARVVWPWCKPALEERATRPTPRGRRSLAVVSR